MSMSMISKQAKRQECEICGAAVPRPSGPVTVGGTYGGWTYTWDSGLLRLVAIRCAAHPLHEELTEQEEQERASLDRAAFELEKAEMEKAGF